MSDSKTLESLGYKQELKRTLSVADLVVYGLIFMVPIAPFGIFGTVMNISEGMVVLAYMIGMVGMIFTAFSYWRMSEEFPISGSVYGYATHAIGKGVGFVSGWAILLDYILVPALLYVVAAVALQSIIPGVPFWAWVVFFVVFNTIINIIGIQFTNSLNWIMLVFEVIVFIVFCVSAVIYIVNNPEVSFTLKPIFNPDKFSIGIVLSAVSVCVLSFLGFDGISTLAEEARGGKDSIGRASIWALVLVGGFFFIQTYLAACVIPWEGAATFANIDEAFYEVAAVAGGAKLMWICAIATGLAWGIADCMVAQAAISRIIFSMARDGFLPKPLAKVHPRFKTPHIATLLIAVLSLLITLVFTQGIQDLAELINFGALSAFIILNFTVVYYFIYKKKSKQYFKHLVLPVIGLFVIGVVWFSLSRKAMLLGVIWVIIGILIYLFLSRIKKKDLELEV
ncbi:MAG TPA: amino acid permease [Firmicutes bacterium]|jgi:amino acid transporter|nr:amino acid permease [Bacillota bacterium]